MLRWTSIVLLRHTRLQCLKYFVLSLKGFTCQSNHIVQEFSLHFLSASTTITVFCSNELLIIIFSCRLTRKCIAWLVQRRTDLFFGCGSDDNCNLRVWTNLASKFFVVELNQVIMSLGIMEQNPSFPDRAAFFVIGSHKSSDGYWREPCHPGILLQPSNKRSVTISFDDLFRNETLRKQSRPLSYLSTNKTPFLLCQSCIGINRQPQFVEVGNKSFVLVPFSIQVVVKKFVYRPVSCTPVRQDVQQRF
mmetsp:Transcript_21528/g.50983  ORF Transcript_21528/g.50983 Transcript_21528/m.50983 type:complete len:248 (+) Transcript_21528:703-1446(+)